jgi:Polyketide cyclase / dehydrase and lipid transport
MTFTAKHISVSINRSAAQVYEFASNPENLPNWAAGLSGSIRKVNNDDWIAESPMGTVRVKFTETNKFGILDHDVTLPSGVKVYNPMRVFPNNDGRELVFTLYRRQDISDQEFAEDARSVEKDFAKLKTLLEKLISAHQQKSLAVGHPIL